MTRDPFPGNIIPDNRINPIARNVLNYFPPPNQAGQADLSNNFFAEQPWTYGYDLQLTRIDHEWTPQHRTYGRFIRNFRREERFNFAGEINGVEISRGSTDRFNYNYAVGHTAILSPSLFLDVEGSWLRFNDDLHPMGSCLPRELGYPASHAVAASAITRTFRASPSNRGRQPPPAAVVTLGAQQSGFNTGRAQPFYNLQFAPTLTWTRSNHTWRFGYDWRELRQTEVNEGLRGGAYAFDGTYTRASSTAVEPIRPGHRLVPARPSAERLVHRAASRAGLQVISHGFFVHDDWRVSEQLTLNLGVRYDLELGMTEAENRNVRGFDFTTANPIQAQAQARSPPIPRPACR